MSSLTSDSPRDDAHTIIARRQLSLQECWAKVNDDLLEAIIGQADWEELRVLNQVSQRFHEIVSRRLLRTISIHEDQNSERVFPPRRRGIKLNIQYPERLKFLKDVRYIRFETSFRERRLWRCSDKPDFETLKPIFEKLQKNILLGFGWNLGQCLPSQLFGPEGYLGQSQSTIKSLSFITDFTCRSRFCRSDPPAHLTAFKNLRQLSWKGLKHSRHLISVHDLLQSNSGKIQSLELDFNSWSEVEDYWIKPENKAANIPLANIFVERVLPTDAHGLKCCFSQLSTLFLSAVPLNSAPPDLAQALNISRLRSLTLLNCVDIPLFLKNVVDSGIEIRLTYLEMLFEDDIQEGWADSALKIFLESFRGLEHLRILLKPSLTTTKYWSSLANHIPTLKSFVYHERAFNMELGDYITQNNFEDLEIEKVEELERPEDPGTTEERHSPSKGFYGAFFDRARFECLGLSVPRWGLRTQLEGTSNHHLKLVHFRYTSSYHKPHFEDWYYDWRQVEKGSKLPQLHFFRRHRDAESSEYDLGQVFSFTQWAFGTFGLPHLQIVAWGDFQHNGRYTEEMLFLVRSGPRPPDFIQNFRVIRWPLSNDDYRLIHSSGIDQPLKFLSACPVDSLFVESNRRSDWPGGY